MTSIDLIRVSNPEAGEKLAATIQGTYMRLQCIVAPVGGEWLVSCFTSDDHSEAELTDMVVAVLCENAIR